MPRRRAQLEAGGAQQQRVQPASGVVALGAGGAQRPEPGARLGLPVRRCGSGDALHRGHATSHLRSPPRSPHGARRVERRQDPRGQMRGTSTVDELEQLVQVDPLLVGEHVGEVGAEPALRSRPSRHRTQRSRSPVESPAELPAESLGGVGGGVRCTHTPLAAGAPLSYLGAVSAELGWAALIRSYDAFYHDGT